MAGALQEAVGHFGERILSDPHVLDNVLSDLLPDDPTEARLLVLAAEHDLAGSLSELHRQLSTDEAIGVASSRFAESYPIEPLAAVWATRRFAEVLGFAAPPPAAPSVTAPLTSPQSPAPPITTPPWDRAAPSTWETVRAASLPPPPPLRPRPRSPCPPPPRAAEGEPWRWRSSPPSSCSPAWASCSA